MPQELIVVGLGNPGDEYSETRHNVGFHCLDSFARRHRLKWSVKPPTYHTAERNLRGLSVVLVKPNTFVNLSGRALADFDKRRSIVASDVLVIADDFALPLGRLRLRKQGGDGGHNGMKSIIAFFGSQRFARLRLGVGPVPDGVAPPDFVLDDFLENERPVVGELVERAVDCVEAIVFEGFDRAMNRFNITETD